MNHSQQEAFSLSPVLTTKTDLCYVPTQHHIRKLWKLYHSKSQETGNGLIYSVAVILMLTSKTLK